MNKTRLSADKSEVFPPQGHLFSVEAFFGMPRRLQLVADDDGVSGVIQSTYGANYAGWIHPLSPYYRRKAGEAALPIHPRAGVFSYRHWRGVVAQAGASELESRAACLTEWEERTGFDWVPVGVIVGGWWMDKMKPRDFVYSHQPLLKFPEDGELTLIGMIEAAEQASLALAGALSPVLASGAMREGEREGFFLATEPAFLGYLDGVASGISEDEVSKAWLNDMRQVALTRFDAIVMPLMDKRGMRDIGTLVAARRKLLSDFAGYTPLGGKIFKALGLERPSGKKGKAA